MIRGSILPTLGAVISIPDPFRDTARGRIAHMRAARYGVDLALSWHNGFLFAEKFKPGNADKYDFKERDDSYVTMRQRVFRSYVDLIKRGSSRDSMMSQAPKTSFKNKMPTGVLWGYQRYEWPHPVGANTPDGVTKEDMNREIGAWTQGEIQGATEIFQTGFANEYNRLIAGSPQFKKTIGDVHARI